MLFSPHRNGLQPIKFTRSYDAPVGCRTRGSSAVANTRILYGGNYSIRLELFILEELVDFDIIL